MLGKERDGLSASSIPFPEYERRKRGEKEREKKGLYLSRMGKEEKKQREMKREEIVW